jgi:FMN-dependent oxidoreductase (nitrilotriacetate monooxygenase family)
LQTSGGWAEEYKNVPLLSDATGCGMACKREFSMAAQKKKLVLALVPKGAPFSWRYSQAQAEADLDFEYYRHLAATAERGKFDVIFLADSLSVRADRIGLAGLKGFGNVVYLEAMTLLSALAVVTKNIGLVATASTTYNEPYHLARKFASIDHISKGRAGWNVITSGQDTEAFNFGLNQQLSNEARYERASEFLEVVLDLWDSWEDEAVVRDRAAHTFFDPERVHPSHHEGKHFKVRGPLNVSRPPQGHPLICQAGASEAGWEFAARTADVMYARAGSLEDSQRFYAGVKSRLAKYNRTPDQIKILPGAVVIVGKTEKEAREKFRAVQDCMTEEEGRAMLAHYIPGIDFLSLSLDEPIPKELEIAARKFRILLDRGGKTPTLREIFNSISTVIGNLTLIGSPGQIADTMETWLNEDGADGFNITPHYLPGGLEDFVDLVVPELQSRGLFRTEYEGTTLRENLGLPRPPNRHIVRRQNLTAPGAEAKAI